MRHGLEPASCFDLPVQSHERPYENGNAHIDGVGFAVERGIANLRTALDEAGIDYETTTVETGSDH